MFDNQTIVNRIGHGLETDCEQRCTNLSRLLKISSTAKQVRNFAGLASQRGGANTCTGCKRTGGD
jgi:hypothetical protein